MFAPAIRLIGANFQKITDEIGDINAKMVDEFHEVVTTNERFAKKLANDAESVVGSFKEAADLYSRTSGGVITQEGESASRLDNNDDAIIIPEGAYGHHESGGASKEDPPIFSVLSTGGGLVEAPTVFDRPLKKQKTSKVRNPGELPTVALFYGTLSWLAYNTTPENRTIPGWTVDLKLSGLKRTVYTRGNGVVVAYRGTKDKKDVWADIGLVVLNKTTRYDVEKDVMATILKKYKGKTITVCGHSLGGAVAKNVYDHHQKALHQMHAFNPGITRIDNKPPTSGVYTWRIEGDPVSILKGKAWNIDTFLPLSTLGFDPLSRHSSQQFIS